MPNPNEDTPEITPQVIHLIDLLKRAKEGRLRVPNFQRDFIWRRQDIIDLFDSIARQYPIGTLFLWGSTPAPRCRPKIGPLALPDYTGESFMVLDGQQRLTTLVGVLLKGESLWSTEGDDDPERWTLYFDAESNVFAHAVTREPVPSSYAPVPSLLDTMKIYDWVAKMKSVEQTGSSPGASEMAIWVNRVQEVARALQRYRIPIVEIQTNDLSIAVESFSRLNKKGRSIGQDEMFSALTYEDSGTGSFHLASEIDGLQRDMKRSGFGEVERGILLRSVLTAANLDLYRTDWTRLGDQLKKDARVKLPAAIEEARGGLELARAFLRSLGVMNQRMLPYSMQLVALSGFYGRCPEPTPSQVALLRRWFWSSSFAGWFGSQNPTRVRRLVEELRDTVSKNHEPQTLSHMRLEQPALPTPLRFDLRSARVRALLCVLFKREPRGQDGSPFGSQEAARILLERGPEAMTTLCATVHNDDLRRSPVNRVLDVAQSPRAQAKNWILSVPEGVRDSVLDSHAIPPEAFPLLVKGDNEAFLQKRLDLMSSIEREFMRQEQVTPPDSDTPAPAQLDADDVPPLEFDF
jgi:hypothetical protein